MRIFSYEYEPAQIMREIIKKYDKPIYFDKNKKNLYKFINKSYSKHKELKNILLNAVEFGIPEELLKFQQIQQKTDKEQQIRRIVRRFCEKYNYAPESDEINEAISCFTFSLDYGMFKYEAYPIQIQQQTQVSEFIELLDTVMPASEEETEEEKEVLEVSEDEDDFVDFKTWFAKKQIEEEELRQRDENKIFIRSSDSNYYELEQTDYLTEPGTSFTALYKKFDENFGFKKKEREMIKMGIDICFEIEDILKKDIHARINLMPGNILRDKYGNYRLKREQTDSGSKNYARELGLFMRELLDAGEKTDNNLLDSVILKACESDCEIKNIKRDLEYAFELSLDELLFNSGASDYNYFVLSDIKANTNKFTDEDIQDVIIPDDYTAIGARAFIRREKLRSVIIHEGISDIHGFAFGWCENLISMTISEGANINIGNFAFWGCDNLRKVTMRGTNVKNIGDCAFYGCQKLKIDIYGNINGDADSLLERAFYGCRDLEVNIYTDGKRKEKRYDRIYNNRIQFY